MEIDMNKLAIRVAELEGKKEEVNIAQIKEVIKNTFLALKEMTGDTHGLDVLDAIDRTWEKYRGDEEKAEGY